MSNNYDKYIKRLRQKRAENPEYAFYRQTMQNLTEPVKRVNQAMQGNMLLAGSSSGAMAQAGLNSQNSLQGAATNLYSQYSGRAMERNDRLDSQIMGMEMQRDKEQDAKKDNALKSGLMIGTTALGAVAGIPMGNPMLGAQVGSGVGGILGGMVGSGGEFGMQNADPDVIAQGIGDTLAGISAISTLNTQKQQLNQLTEAIPLMKGMDSSALEVFKLKLTAGDIPGALAILDGVNAAGDTTMFTMDNYQQSSPAPDEIISGVEGSEVAPAEQTAPAPATDASQTANSQESEFRAYMKQSGYTVTDKTATETLIKAYQRANKLTVTGQMDSATVAHMRKYKAVK